MKQLELTQNEYLLNAVKVLFSDDITQDIQLAIFATTEKTTFNDIQRHHGSVTKLVDLAEFIKENGSVSNREARKILNLAESTTKRLLKSMVDEGALIIKGQKKARRYKKEIVTKEIKVMINIPEKFKEILRGNLAVDI